MIVVDTNVIAYCWIRGDRTALAQRIRLQDPDWHVPVLWRSELRNVLALQVGRATLALEDASAVMAAAESAVAGREHLMTGDTVLGLAARTGLSGYDCEFVALAQALLVPLVTEDRAVLRAFPNLAFTMEAYLADAAARPEARSPRGRYAVSRRRAPPPRSSKRAALS
jgi:predicted nucleic acid-binding protein